MKPGCNWSFLPDKSGLAFLTFQILIFRRPPINPVFPPFAGTLECLLCRARKYVSHQGNIRRRNPPQPWAVPWMQGTIFLRLSWTPQISRCWTGLINGSGWAGSTSASTNSPNTRPFLSSWRIMSSRTGSAMSSVCGSGVNGSGSSSAGKTDSRNRFSKKSSAVLSGTYMVCRLLLMVSGVRSFPAYSLCRNSKNQGQTGYRDGYPRF